MVILLTFVASNGLEDILVAFHNMAPDEHSLAEKLVCCFRGGADYLERRKLLLSGPVAYEFQP